LLATAGQSPMAGMNNGFLLYCMIHYPAALDMTLLGLKGLLHNFIKKHATLASMYQRIGPVKLVLQAIDVIVSELIINQIIKGMISTNWNK
jgi:hypothetical protein